ncbi:acyltransferase [Telluria aromaticivorans]|nr:acyltransferase [Telluria aromaticivorans]
MAHPSPLPNPFNPGYYRSEELRQFGFGQVGENVMIAKNATIIGLENISIGNNVRIDGGVVLAAHSGSLVVGDYIHIGGGSYLGCAGGITLGDFANLSQGVRIYSSSDDYSGEALTNPTVPPAYLKLTKAPVALGRHVIVGSGSVILPGANIGEGSAVGALSLVLRPLEAWGIYAGAPARRLKARSRALLELEQALLANKGC